MRLIYVSILCLLILPTCVKNNSVNLNQTTVNGVENEEITVKIDPFRVRSLEIASSLDDRYLIAQIFICGIDGRGSLPPHMKSLLGEFPTGGVMLFKYNLDTENDAIRALLTETAELIESEAGLSPFIAVDHEGGAVNRFSRDVATLPSPASYRRLSLSEGEQAALSKIETDSFNAGFELNNLGINMNFAPVVEFLNIDNSEFLKYRSYGDDPSFTAEAAAAFVRGMERSGVLCVIKHFPGSAGPDPHYSAGALNLDKAALDNLVFPFTTLIKNGAMAVMAAHTAVPAIDDKIASLSSVVMKNWLREELGFNGIIISDDFIMAAAGEKSPEEAAIRSIAAGADMVLVWPSDLRRTHAAFVSALEDGRLSRDRLLDAASRVIYEKLQLGLVE